MTRPPRPTPVVAAAVLLIVVGSEVLLAVIAGTGWLVFAVGLGDCACCGAWLFAFGLLTAIHFLATGIDTLTGNLVDPVRAGNPVLVAGGIAALLSLLTVGCGLWATLGRKFEWAAMTRDEGMIVSGVLLLWSNTAALLTAGLILHGHANAYLRWREAIHKRPEDDGYEPDVEA